MMQSAECPSCSEEIILPNNVQLGQRVDCPHCDAVLKVIWLDPPELEWLDLEADDEDYEFDEDYLDEDELDDDFFFDEDEDEEEDDDDLY